MSPALTFGLDSKNQFRNNGIFIKYTDKHGTFEKVPFFVLPVVQKVIFLDQS
jgi:hypothetical protein